MDQKMLYSMDYTFFSSIHATMDILMVVCFWRLQLLHRRLESVFFDYGFLRMFPQTWYAMILWTTPCWCLSVTTRSGLIQPGTKSSVLNSNQGSHFPTPPLRILHLTHISLGLSDRYQLKPGFCLFVCLELLVTHCSWAHCPTCRGDQALSMPWGLMWAYLGQVPQPHASLCRKNRLLVLQESKSVFFLGQLFGVESLFFCLFSPNVYIILFFSG